LIKPTSTRSKIYKTFGRPLKVIIAHLRNLNHFLESKFSIYVRNKNFLFLYLIFFLYQVTHFFSLISINYDFNQSRQEFLFLWPLSHFCVFLILRKLSETILRETTKTLLFLLHIFQVMDILIINVPIKSNVWIRHEGWL